MDAEHITEFLRQLTLLSELMSQDVTQVLLPKHFGSLHKNEQNAVSVYGNLESPTPAVWVSAPEYRARVMVRNSNVYITDLRVYDSALTDPYQLEPNPAADGYWIVPFVFDTSRFPIDEKVLFENQRDFQFFAKKDQKLYEKNADREIIRDYLAANPASIRISSVDQNSLRIDRSKTPTLYFENLDGDSLQLRWEPGSFLLIGASEEPQQNFEKLPETSLTVTTEIFEGKTSYRFTPRIEWEVVEESFWEAFPERYAPWVSTTPLSLKNSEIEVHGKWAILGRNNPQYVIWLENELGQPANPQQSIHIKPSDQYEAEILYPASERGVFIINIIGDTIGSFSPVIEVDGQERVLPKVWLIKNCKTELAECVKQPRQFVLYGVSKADERLKQFAEVLSARYNEMINR